MRLGILLCALVTLFAAVGSASAAPKLPNSGFVVYKDLRSYAVTEIRDKATGRVVASEVSFGDTTAPGTACGDSRHKFTGFRWRAFEPYVVNAASTPGYMSASETLADLRAAHAAWESPFTTDCADTPTTSKYRAIYGGDTSRLATAVSDLRTDGVNVVAFQSLAGTVCDGALACVVAEFKGTRLNEADLAFESDLTRYGYQDFWTTDDTTWTDAVGGRFSVSDTATHEFGHWAGLDHVLKSPALTMFPFIHDGAQTLGLGDMKGILARY